MALFPMALLVGLAVLGLLVAGVVLLVVFLARRKALGAVLGIVVGVLFLLIIGTVLLRLTASPTSATVAYEEAPVRQAGPAEPYMPSKAAPPVPTAARWAGTTRPFLLLILALGAAGVVLLVVFLARRKALGAGLAIGGGVVLVLLVLGAFFLIGVPMAMHRDVAYEQRHATVERQATENPVPSVYEQLPADEQRQAAMQRQAEAMRRLEAAKPAVPSPSSPIPVEATARSGDLSAFLADVYPSREQAVAAVAKSLAESVPAMASAGEADLPVVRVTGKAPAALLEAAREAFQGSGSARQALASPIPAPAAGPEADPNAGKSAADAVLCIVQADEGTEGNVHLTLSGPRGQVSRSTRFVDKPWAADFGLFLGRSPQPRLLAQSGGPCASHQEAEWKALEHAAASLLPRIQAAVQRQLATHRSGGAVPDLRTTQAMVLSELQRGNLVEDRFIQRYARPYGDVWRTSLLVDGRPPAMDVVAGKVAVQAMREGQATMATWLRVTATVGGLAVLIVAVYLILNAATKGYYVWVLRLAAAGLIAAGVIVVLFTA